MLIFSAASCAFSQQENIISGKVQSLENKPLENVIVTNLSTNENAETDADGNFKIKASKSDIIVVEGLDYQSLEIVVSDQTNYQLTLIKSVENELNEVVVTALGITKEQKKVGYATQEIGTGTIERVTTPNVGNLFSGQVAGLYVSNPPGMQQAPAFNLRGKTPVIVIDGDRKSVV